VPDVRVIAHRGSSTRAPENTLMAFRAASEDGADGIECDARLTADGVVVLMHDDDIARTTYGSGKISELSFEQLHEIKVHGREPIPTLDEMLTLVGGRTAVVVEIKGAFGGARTVLGAEVARAVVPIIIGVPAVLASSFDPSAVSEVRALAPAVPTAITVGGYSSLDEALALAIEVGHVEVHAPVARVDAAFVARAHEAGRAVLAYTVNDPGRAAELEAMGVDGIFSDDPAAVRAR
jgi:glycerophosphoryl diester phosphodiesterase